MPAPSARTRTQKNTRYIVGCMTGTSIDALSAALVRIEGHDLQMKVFFEDSLEAPFGLLGDSLRKVAEQVPLTAKEITKIAWDFGTFHAQALEPLVRQKNVDLIVLHGQTVFHAPPLSWQMINPAPVAQAFKIPLVFDLRASDLAQGGEGAPMTPLSDFIVFRGSEKRAVVNLGGFCNITLLPNIEKSQNPLEKALNAVQGKDICACNQVLDFLARTLFQTAYDANGENAALGTLQQNAFDALVQLLTAQAQEGRSLGTGDELSQWVLQHKKSDSKGLARTACAAIAQVIVNHTLHADRLILAGGGVHNRVLQEEIAARASVPVVLSDSFGFPVAFREAAAMAILGALCEDGVPITLPQVTGVKSAPVSGVWIFP